MDALSAVVEPLSIAANCAQIVGTLSAVSPSGGSRASQNQRRSAYLNFERAMHEATAAATHLRVLAAVLAVPQRAVHDRVKRAADELKAADRSLAERFTRAAKELADQSTLDRGRRALRGFIASIPGSPVDGRLPRLGLAAFAPLARMAVARDLTGDLINQLTVHEAARNARDTLASYAAALSEVRLGGRPAVREEAEKLTALLGELFGRVSGSETEFNECLNAIGVLNQRFILAARADLDRKKWHVSNRTRAHWYQPWRPSVPNWPGGWPGPNAKALIASVAPASSSGDVLLSSASEQ